MGAVIIIGSARKTRLVACQLSSGYRHAVAANSVAGRGNPSKSRRKCAAVKTVGAFILPAVSSMAAACGQASAWLGSLIPGISTPYAAATQSRGKDRGSSSNQGTQTMTAINPSDTRAAAHRAMAMAALRANSSLAVRLRRYNHHMDVARSLESAKSA